MWQAPSNLAAGLQVWHCDYRQRGQPVWRQQTASDTCTHTHHTRVEDAVGERSTNKRATYSWVAEAAVAKLASYLWQGNRVCGQDSGRRLRILISLTHSPCYTPSSWRWVRRECARPSLPCLGYCCCGSGCVVTTRGHNVSSASTHACYPFQEQWFVNTIGTRRRDNRIVRFGNVLNV